MKSYKLALVSGFILLTLSFCKKDDTSSSAKEKTLPYYLLLTDTVFEVYDTQITLKGQPIEDEETCLWTIVTDSSKTGGLEDALKATTKFSGKLFNTYVVKYSMTKGSETKSQLVTIKFIVPDVLKSKTLESFYTDDPIDTVISLNAVALGTGVTGKWRIIQNDPFQSGSLDDSTKADAKFTGRLAYTYKLYWEISDGTQTKGDTLSLKLNSFTDSRDNEKYKVIRVGSQLWMAQNIRYKNPSEIFTSSSSYNNADFTSASFGNLYTFQQISNAAPTGWRVAKSSDWTSLFTYANQQTNYIGLALKSSYGWSTYTDPYSSVTSDGGGNDLFGLNILPGGFKINTFTKWYFGGSWTYVYSSTQFGLGKYSIFWTPDIEGTNANWAKIIAFSYGSYDYFNDNQSIKSVLTKEFLSTETTDNTSLSFVPAQIDLGNAYSVRCIKN